MASAAEANWIAFRRYDIKGFRISQTSKEIVFLNKEFSTTRMYLVFLSTGILAFVLIGVMFGVHDLISGLTSTNSTIISTVSMVALFAGFIFLLVRFVYIPKELRIMPGFVEWRGQTRRYSRSSKRRVYLMVAFIIILILAIFLTVAVIEFAQVVIENTHLRKKYYPN